MAQNQEANYQFFQEILNEFHKRDLPKHLTIFKPPEEYLEDLEKKLSLAIVEEELLDGTYDNDCWMFIHDVSEALDILIERFTVSSATHKKAKMLKKIFNDRMDKYMKKNGYCCGQWFISKAKDITCSAGSEENECILKNGENFYRYDNITYCESHLNEKCNQDTKIVMLTETRFIHISKIVKYTFLKELDEFFVRCEHCKRFFHERCVVQTKYPGKEFYCVNCRHSRDFRFDRLEVDKIPNTDFDIFIKEFMEKNMYMNFNQKFTIRMLNCGITSFDVECQIRNFCLGMPDKISYTNCTIFGFFKDDAGFDVCCLALYIQLYGNDAPKPNMNSAYISYIDSVKLYSGEDRTRIYHTIILGIFDYLRIKGYKRVFIWSCPPAKGVDYVFPFKPLSQKMPDSNLLDGWYVKIFERGKQMKIINEFQGVESFAFYNEWNKIENIPIFHEDLWAIKLATHIGQFSTEYLVLNINFKANGMALSGRISEKVLEKLRDDIKTYDKSYFVLTFENPKNELQDIKGVAREWIGNRHLLVDFFCEPKIMFYNMRQAKFATYCLLYRIYLERSRCVRCQERKNLDPYLLCDECSQTASNHRYLLRTEEERKIINVYKLKMQKL